MAEYEQLWTPSIEFNRAESSEELWDGDTACMPIHTRFTKMRKKQRLPVAYRRDSLTVILTRGMGCREPQGLGHRGGQVLTTVQDQGRWLLWTAQDLGPILWCISLSPVYWFPRLEGTNQVYLDALRSRYSVSLTPSNLSCALLDRSRTRWTCLDSRSTAIRSMSRSGPSTWVAKR